MCYWTKETEESNIRAQYAIMPWILQYLRIDMFIRWISITKGRHQNSKGKQTPQGDSAKFKFKMPFQIA